MAGKGQDTQSQMQGMMGQEQMTAQQITQQQQLAAWSQQNMMNPMSWGQMPGYGYNPNMNMNNMFSAAQTGYQMGGMPGMTGMAGYGSGYQQPGAGTASTP